VFAGIVDSIGILIFKEKSKGFDTIKIQTQKGFTERLKKGASVAVNGVCLTAKSSSSNCLEFDVVKETLLLTNLSELQDKDKVNLERSITAATEIGGHLVSGHVHGTAKIVSIEPISKGAKDIVMELPNDLMEYVFYKGYIAINGCSLTVGNLEKNSIKVHLIPETLEITNLNDLTAGDKVNVEIDQNSIMTVDTIKKVLSKKED
tara:strand:+ start:1008 stop:1622 length:615 start_codon:yes stop_codon:yes gene_type:complete